MCNYFHCVTNDVLRRHNRPRHGLRTPNKAFFHQNPKLLSLGRIWADKIWGIFGQFISTHFVTESPLSMFFKKLRLYIQIPNIYLVLGFEFGPQRIRDLAIVCP